jgi:hypothetical protein
MALTANYGWEIPDVDQDDDTWGDIEVTLYDAIDAQLKAVDNKASAAAVDSVINALVLAAAPPAKLGYFGRAAAPAGWVKANGLTIGNAASGATNRAHADTEALFTVFWNDWSNTLLPIQDSTGTPSVRGANAAADFAANKRLPVRDMRTEFVRGIDDGRAVDALITLGYAKLDQMQGHRHILPGIPQNGSGSSYGGAGAGVQAASNVIETGDPKTDGSNGAPRTGLETHPRFVGLLACWKL